MRAGVALWFPTSQCLGRGVLRCCVSVGATGGAYVTILDDNTLTKPEAFSPTIHIPALSTGMVEFKIEFVRWINQCTYFFQISETTSSNLL